MWYVTYTLGFVVSLPIIIRKQSHPYLRDRVHFIDTRFINEPMWDTAPDFNHIHDRVANIEAMYLAAQVLLGSS